MRSFRIHATMFILASLLSKSLQGYLRTWLQSSDTKSWNMLKCCKMSLTCGRFFSIMVCFLNVVQTFWKMTEFWRVYQLRSNYGQMLTDVFPFFASWVFLLLFIFSHWWIFILYSFSIIHVFPKIAFSYMLILIVILMSIILFLSTWEGS